MESTWQGGISDDPDGPGEVRHYCILRYGLIPMENLGILAQLLLLVMVANGFDRRRTAAGVWAIKAINQN